MQQAAATHLEQFPWNHQQQQHRHQAVESISWDMGWMRIECHRSSQWSSLCTCTGNASSWSPDGRGEQHRWIAEQVWEICSCDEWVKFFEDFIFLFYWIAKTISSVSLSFFSRLFFIPFRLYFFQCLFTGKALCVSIVAQFLLYGKKQLTQPLASAISLSFFFVWRIVIFLYDYYNNNYNS